MTGWLHDQAICFLLLLNLLLTLWLYQFITCVLGGSLFSSSYKIYYGGKTFVIGKINYHQENNVYFVNELVIPIVSKLSPKKVKTEGFDIVVLLEVIIILVMLQTLEVKYVNCFFLFLLGQLFCLLHT